MGGLVGRSRMWENPKNLRNRRPAAPFPSALSTLPSWAFTAWSVGAIALATGVAYWNSLGVPFVFDDGTAIVKNASIRHLASAFHPPGGGATVTGRPLLNLSFAFNYAWDGLAVGGYHAVNLGIHLLAGLALFGIVRRTLRRLSGAAETGRERTLALAAALI